VIRGHPGGGGRLGSGGSPQEPRAVEGSDSAQQNEAASLSGEDRYRRLVERSNDMILTLDPEGIVTTANLAAERILGFSPEEIVGTSIMLYTAPGELERAGALFARIAAGADFVNEEFEHVAKGGHRVFLDVMAYPIVEGGQLVGVEGIARDVSERHALQEALAHQALHDALTGLPNRTLFSERLGEALAGAGGRRSKVAVMLLDLDGFKLINDTLGHGVGDEALVAVARRLSGALRAGDTVARLGGDEFAFILESAEAEPGFAAYANRILAALAAPPILDDHATPSRASLGIAIARPGDDATAVLRNADIAMYQAKRESQGGYHFYAA
jgi:diguanylate cyclase (GGDEF)-like protein/PAS domain S-box-containing protein